MEKGVPINFTKFTGKYLYQSVFLILLKKKLWHRRFPINFAKFLKSVVFAIEQNEILSQHMSN